MTHSRKSYRSRKKSGTVRVRKNIRKLSEEELQDLRKAYEGLYTISQQEITDQRGYQWIAGVHGLPLPIFCQHGTGDFLTWHRAYIYEFEKRLQDIVPSVTLPYWDWTSERSIAEGLPDAVTADTYVDENGDEKPNPLKKAFSQATGTDTSRNPKPPADLQQLADAVAAALQSTNFSDLTPAVESPHGGLHVWVRDDMGSVPTSSYDPIFWMHHCNVDRQWWQWQQQNPNADYSPAVRNFVCTPFSYTGEQTLDLEAFSGVTYADYEAVAEPDDAAPEAERDDALPPVLTFDAGGMPTDFKHARLEFHNLKKTADSYEIRVYVNAPEAQAETGTYGNNRYCGSHYIFGHGRCYGAPGHCEVPSEPPDKYDHRPPHHLTPYNTYIDVTKALRAAVDRGDSPIKLHFVVLDVDGDQVTPDVIEYESISLLTRK